MEQSVDGDDPGEIETGDVIKRDPGAGLAGDPGEIELVDLREGQQEVTDAGETSIGRSGSRGEATEIESDIADPGTDPGGIELEEIVGDTGERYTDG